MYILLYLRVFKIIFFYFKFAILLICPLSWQTVAFVASRIWVCCSRTRLHSFCAATSARSCVAWPKDHVHYCLLIITQQLSSRCACEHAGRSKWTRWCSRTWRLCSLRRIRGCPASWSRSCGWRRASSLCGATSRAFERSTRSRKSSSARVQFTVRCNVLYCTLTYSVHCCTCKFYLYDELNYTDFVLYCACDLNSTGSFGSMLSLAHSTRAILVPVHTVVHYTVLYLYCTLQKFTFLQVHLLCAARQVLTGNEKPLFAWWTSAHTGAALITGTAILMVRHLQQFWMHNFYSIILGQR